MFQRFVQFAFIGLLAATGCEKSMPAAEGRGGISGGGGNTLVRDAAIAEDVIRTAQLARPQLHLFFNRLSAKPEALSPELYEKLFAGETIFKALNDFGISFALDRPCYEDGGKERDGSINSPKAGDPGICISPFRIAGTVSRDEVRPQVLALIAHEYSHLLGSTEAEAVIIQDLIREVARATSWDELKAYADACAVSMQAVRAKINAVYDFLEKDSEDREVFMQIAKLLGELSKLDRQVLGQSGFSGATRSELDSFESLSKRYFKESMDVLHDREKVRARLDTLSSDELTGMGILVMGVGNQFMVAVSTYYGDNPDVSAYPYR